jgi:hypothetical protein
MSEHTPEAALWRAVVTQAVLDASWEQGNSKGDQTGDGFTAARRDEARAWLLGDSRDFRQVCFMAGFDPDAVRESAQRKDQTGWPAVRLMRAA